MNEQLQQALATTIEKSIKAFEAGADFMVAEIPDVVHQLLLWHCVMSAAQALAAVVIWIGILFWVKYQIKYWSEEVEDRRYGKGSRLLDKFGVLAAFNLLLPIPVIASITMFNLRWLQIWIAPKIFLIEYVAGLAK